MDEKMYPALLDRVKAVIGDSVVLIAMMLTITSVFSFFEQVPDAARVTAFVFVFGLYDPLMTSTFGGTIGHLMVGLRVRRDSDEQRKILFPFALVRFFIKALLGWISLLVVMGNDKRRAIHDYATGSVVVYHIKS